MLYCKKRNTLTLVDEQVATVGDYLTPTAIIYQHLGWSSLEAMQYSVNIICVPYCCCSIITMGLNFVFQNYCGYVATECHAYLQDSPA